MVFLLPGKRRGPIPGDQVDYWGLLIGINNTLSDWKGLKINLKKIFFSAKQFTKHEYR
jgi:hypothetical protein